MALTVPNKPAPVATIQGKVAVSSHAEKNPDQSLNSNPEINLRKRLYQRLAEQKELRAAIVKLVDLNIQIQQIQTNIKALDQLGAQNNTKARNQFEANLVRLQGEKINNKYYQSLLKKKQQEENDADSEYRREKEELEGVVPKFTALNLKQEKKLKEIKDKYQQKFDVVNVYSKSIELESAPELQKECQTNIGLLAESARWPNHIRESELNKGWMSAYVKHADVAERSPGLDALYRELHNYCKRSEEMPFVIRAKAVARIQYLITQCATDKSSVANSVSIVQDPIRQTTWTNLKLVVTREEQALRSLPAEVRKSGAPHLVVATKVDLKALPPKKLPSSPKGFWKTLGYVITSLTIIGLFVIGINNLRLWNKKRDVKNQLKKFSDAWKPEPLVIEKNQTLAHTMASDSTTKMLAGQTASSGNRVRANTQLSSPEKTKTASPQQALQDSTKQNSSKVGTQSPESKKFSHEVLRDSNGSSGKDKYPVYKPVKDLEVRASDWLAGHVSDVYGVNKADLEKAIGEALAGLPMTPTTETSNINLNKQTVAGNSTSPEAKEEKKAILTKDDKETVKADLKRSQQPVVEGQHLTMAATAIGGTDEEDSNSKIEASDDMDVAAMWAEDMDMEGSPNRSPSYRP